MMQIATRLSHLQLPSPPRLSHLQLPSHPVMCTFGLVARVDRTYCTALAGALKYVIIIIISQQHLVSSEEVCGGKVRKMENVDQKCLKNCIITHSLPHSRMWYNNFRREGHYVTVVLMCEQIHKFLVNLIKSFLQQVLPSFSCCHKPRVTRHYW